MHLARTFKKSFLSIRSVTTYRDGFNHVGPWAQDRMGALFKLRQGAPSTRFVGQSVRLVGT